MKKTKKSQSKSSFGWNEVTPLSRYLAMSLFVALPILGFLYGMSFQQEVVVAACSPTW